jgi:mannosylglucosylglycerate synthase
MVEPALRPLNIALTHYRVGETDGVSLEMDKWRRVLENMGHKVFYIAGSKGTCSEDVCVIDEYEYRYWLDLQIERNAYQAFAEYKDEDELKDAIISASKILEPKISKFITDNKIDIIVPNNVFAIGRSLPTALAFHNVIESHSLKTICHHHDFFFERDKFKNPTCPYITSLLSTIYPPSSPLYTHCVINHPAQKSLHSKRSLPSTVVPNVFDFKAPLWSADSYNSPIRSTLGLSEHDIFILQGTRVVDRKGIELTIDVIAELNKPENRSKLSGTLYNGKEFTEESNLVLVLVGMIESTTKYDERLSAYAAKLNVKLLWKNEWIEHSRCRKECGDVYSLWDAYVFADLVSYPSIYEGWGNQFLEALFAKKPMIVFEYSVFVSDIKEKGFKYASLGQEYVVGEDGLAKVEGKYVKSAAESCIMYLKDKEMRDKHVEENFQIGAKYFSLEGLEEILKTVFPPAE